MVTHQQDEAMERPAGLAARGRATIVGLVRAVPIRWRILSIAALTGVGTTGSARSCSPKYCCCVRRYWAP